MSAVYTTAAVDAEGRATGHSSIDVERVAERRREDPKPQPDLVVRDVRVDLNCGTAVDCELAVGFEVANIGDGPAGPFEVAVTASPGGALFGTEPVEAGLGPGESVVATISVPVPQALIGDAEAICVGADLPADVVAEPEEANNQSCLGI